MAYALGLTAFGSWDPAETPFSSVSESALESGSGLQEVNTSVWCFGEADDIARELGRGAELATGMRVLDIGCNTGNSSFCLARTFDCNVLGVDAAEPAIRVAEQRGRDRFPELSVSFDVVDARDTGFESESFDAVVSKDTFVNIEHRPRLLVEVARLLKGLSGFRNEI